MNTLEKLETKGIDVHNKYVLRIVHTGSMGMKERLQFFREYFLPCILGQDNEMTVTDDRVVITDSTNTLTGIAYLINILLGRALVVKIFPR